MPNGGLVPRFKLSDQCAAHGNAHVLRMLFAGDAHSRGWHALERPGLCRKSTATGDELARSSGARTRTMSANRSKLWARKRVLPPTSPLLKKREPKEACPPQPSNFAESSLLGHDGKLVKHETTRDACFSSR